MKKQIFAIVAVVLFSLSITSCREKTTGEKVGDAVEDVGDDIEDAVDD